MTFSEKRASKRIRIMLVIAKLHASLKGINRGSILDVLLCKTDYRTDNVSAYVFSLVS